MKTFNRTYLVTEISHNGEIYRRNSEISGAMNANNTNINKIARELKLQGRKAILLKCLSAKLKGLTDLHGRPYEPTKWIYTND